MKKLTYFLIATSCLFVFSCEKETLDKENAILDYNPYLKSTSANQISSPVSIAEITPYIIAGVNKGGNRTCEEVAVAFNTSFDMCGSKIEYGTSGFTGSFPQGLNVTVNGNIVSFSMDGSIMLEGKPYKVGAVIVKGANAANIYFYPKGASHDEGLAAPGGKHMVSNLTFCFVQCKPLDIVVAVKTSFWWPHTDGTFYRTYGGSSGPFKPFNQVEWCADLGAYHYPEVKSFEIFRAFVWDKTADVTIEVNGENLIISVQCVEGVTPFGTYVYAGNPEGLKNAVDSNNLPIYITSPWRSIQSDESVQKFTIPLSEL